MSEIFKASNSVHTFLILHSFLCSIKYGLPDMRTCLLHQKLQMLNACRKLHMGRELALPYNKLEQELELDADENDDIEEEFFDCSNEEIIGKTNDEEMEPEGELIETQQQPEGRERRLGDKKLLMTKSPLYIPVTQQPAPKTEDQLQDEAETILRLGSGSGLTAEIMSSSLLSDMEAFKAANPNSQMADFIRWYSPNDWLESEAESGVGQLSLRMKEPGNNWQRIWQQAQPKPIWRQNRLFDHTLEALKVLQYLEARNIGEIYELTLVPLLHAAVLKLKDFCSNAHALEVFNSQFDAILADLSRLSRDNEIVGDSATGFVTKAPSPEHIIEQIESIEKQLYELKCFEQFCSPHLVPREEVNRQFATMLKRGGNFPLNTVLKNGDQSDTMLNFNFKQDLTRNLIRKDYVIRVDGEITSMAKGEMGPQFLRAIITDEHIRLCGAFTENTTFI